MAGTEHGAVDTCPIGSHLVSSPVFCFVPSFCKSILHSIIKVTCKMIEQPFMSKLKNEQSCICVLGVSICLLSTIFLLDSGTVPKYVVLFAFHFIYETFVKYILKNRRVNVRRQCYFHLLRERSRRV